MPVETVRQEFARLRRDNHRVTAVAVAVLIVAICVVGWFSDHRSCERSVPLRAYIIDQIPIDRESEAYWLGRGNNATADRIHKRIVSEMRVQQLSCWSIFPGV